MNIPSIINLFHVNRGDFVESVYTAILGRHPDESGIETFEAMLGSGAASKRRKVILAVASSQEARARNELAPMIAKEALRIRRWRFLPWNRSALAVAVSQSEIHAYFETLLQSVEYRLGAIEVRLGSTPPTSYNSCHTGHSDEPTLVLIEHIMRSLKGLSFSMRRLEGTLKG